MMLRSILATIPGFVMLVLASHVSAQKYPDKVVTVVIPFTAGGPTDTVGRLIAQPMTTVLKQQVSLKISAVPAAPSPPPGGSISLPTYTLLLHHSVCRRRHSLSQAFVNPLTDFEPIGLITRSP